MKYASRHLAPLAVAAVFIPAPPLQAVLPRSYVASAPASAGW